MKTIVASCLLWLALVTAAPAHDTPSRAHYLANEGLMVTHGETKILFDPLFNQDFGLYRLLPPPMRAALLAGEPPWDGIDAVFISHYHDDHFAPRDMLDYLRGNDSVELFAPAQAVAAMREIADEDDGVFDRVTAVRLAFGDEPRQFRRPGLIVEVVRIPHSGWPERRLDVENLAWRVTLDDGPTALHLGDADTRDVHYAGDAEYWQRRYPDVAFPPYWYFLSTSGLEVLAERLKPSLAIGVHVPVSIPREPADREEALRQVDLFTTPGETRDIAHEHR